jgi:hypothetical protein
MQGEFCVKTAKIENINKGKGSNNLIKLFYGVTSIELSNLILRTFE